MLLPLKPSRQPDGNLDHFSFFFFIISDSSVSFLICLNVSVPRTISDVLVEPLIVRLHKVLISVWYRNPVQAVIELQDSDALCQMVLKVIAVP